MRCEVILRTGLICLVRVGLMTGLVAGLAGCGAGNFGEIPVTIVPVVPVMPYSGPTFSVLVRAGSLPLAGATVQFYTAGTTGNGSAAKSLLSTAVVTDATGAALVPANYTCPTANGMVYLTASGGQIGNTSANPGTVLLSAVGACSSVVAGTNVTINEATTVAAAYALQGFLSGNNIGASATNLTGLTNAFATAATLTNAQTGSTLGTTLPSNGTPAVQRVNTLANALNACVVKASACAGLYTATANGSPATTLDAMVNLARNPGTNVGAVYAQAQGSTAYGVGLTSVPLDWTMFINYVGGGLSSPSGIAVDSGGNVWVGSYFQAASKFTPTGAPVFANGVTGYGLNNSYGAAVDLSDNAWFPNEMPFTNQGIGGVTVLTPSGTSAAGPAGYEAGGLNYPISLAIDPNGTTWVVDYGNSHLTLLNSSGTPLSGANGYTTPLFAFPVVVALDGNHFGWIGNQADTTVTKVSPDGTSFTNYNCCNGASGIAVDAGNNIWVANFYGNSVSLISNAGVVVSNGYYTGQNTIDHPQGIAIDGVGNVFVANFRAPYLTELAGSTSGQIGASLSGPQGLGGDAQLLEPFALAVDASGNVWVSNQGSNTVTKYVGLGAPVKTPLSGLPKAP